MFNFHVTVREWHVHDKFVSRRDELFTSQGGAKENANRVLVVITDGESNDRDQLESAAQNAEQKKISRYAIGVRNSLH